MRTVWTVWLVLLCSQLFAQGVGLPEDYSYAEPNDSVIWVFYPSDPIEITSVDQLKVNGRNASVKPVQGYSYSRSMKRLLEKVTIGIKAPFATGEYHFPVELWHDSLDVPLRDTLHLRVEPLTRLEWVYDHSRRDTLVNGETREFEFAFKNVGDDPLVVHGFKTRNMELLSALPDKPLPVGAEWKCRGRFDSPYGLGYTIAHFSMEFNGGRWGCSPFTAYVMPVEQKMPDEVLPLQERYYVNFWHCAGTHDAYYTFAFPGAPELGPIRSIVWKGDTLPFVQHPGYAWLSFSPTGTSGPSAASGELIVDVEGRSKPLRYPLTIEMPGCTQIVFDTTTHNFGKVISGDACKTAFRFRNMGNYPAVLENVKSSCGCVAPRWSKEPVAPGEFGEVEVLFNTQGKIGMNTKSLTVTYNGDPRVIVIYIKADVQPPPPESPPAPANEKR